MTDPAFPNLELAHPAAIAPPAAAAPASLKRLLTEAARSALLKRPRWQGIQASPALVAGLTVADLLATMLVERLYITGSATFYWQAIAGGWIGLAFTAWCCYLVKSPAGVTQTGESDAHPDSAPGAAELFCLMLAQSMLLQLVIGLTYTLLWRNGAGVAEDLSAYWQWLFWLAPLCWVMLMQVLLLVRGGNHRPLRVAAAALVMVTGSVLYNMADPAQFWREQETATPGVERKRLVLTQDVMEAQPRLLSQRLSAIVPQRPGVPDLYAISFAPYANDEVFHLESEMVSEVMARRFDAAGHSLQLVNHPDTVAQWPWATPRNLQRAIQRMARSMDLEEDILFIHLTSHGASNGELSASFWPMTVETVKPDELKKWLDEAGIKNRVISVSACFSGSWIAPLANEDTLVMTASDADHTSYGCGRKSELTYFGRAMFDEQLRNSTLSFEEAHAAARTIIKQREEEAGKDDGYSNPQIAVGSAIRKRLASLQERLQSLQPGTAQAK